jgi:hypothetical protein
VGAGVEGGLVVALDRVHVSASGAGVEDAQDGESKARAIALLQLDVATMAGRRIGRPPLQERVVAIGFADVLTSVT